MAIRAQLRVEMEAILHEKSSQNYPIEIADEIVRQVRVKLATFQSKCNQV
jgi:hypothetical protein